MPEGLETARRLLNSAHACVILVGDRHPPAGQVPDGMAGVLLKPVDGQTCATPSAFLTAARRRSSVPPTSTQGEDEAERSPHSTGTTGASQISMASRQTVRRYALCRHPRSPGLPISSIAVTGPARATLLVGRWWSGERYGRWPGQRWQQQSVMRRGSLNSGPAFRLTSGFLTSGP
jgi:hypothetical protein